MLKGFTRKFKALEILTEGQLEAIHKGTLEILEQTGVRFESKKALKLFEKNGCKIDYDQNRVCFPPGLVEECLRKCPSSYHVRARKPKNDLVIGGDAFYFVTGAGMHTVDLDTWESRLATREENYRGVTVFDALPNIHCLSQYTPYFGFEGVPPVMSMLESQAAKIRNSTKVQWTGYTNDCEMFTIKMAKAVEAEVFGGCWASPPLTYYSDAIESAFRFVEIGFPLMLGSSPIMGGTGPATIAGSTVTGNAELMAGLVLAQLIKPGTKVLASHFSFPQNMKAGSPAFGAIGVSLHQAVFNQIWRKHGVPTSNNAPYASSSKKIDFQLGYEKAIMILTAALSGVNMATLHAAIHGEITAHPVQAVLDDDVAGMIGRFIEGVEVDDETLAIDLIEEIGPIPGFYLNKEHTRKWWKKEQFVPKVADRLTYPEWMNTGKKACFDYAKEKMEEILATYKPAPLTEDQNKEIERILKEARNYYQERDML